MTMVIFGMDVIGDYEPCMGRNTFRLSSERYDTLRPGDRVLMSYREYPEERPYAHEWLTVSSIAFGAFQVMAWRHGEDNHACPAGIEELRKILETAYQRPVLDNDNVFVVYFE